MRDYILSKAISLLIPALLIAYGALFWTGDETEHWRFLILVLIVLGYMHTTVGLVYQLRTFGRAANPRKLWSVFLILTIVSLSICSWFIYNQLEGVFVMFVFAYFILHGFLNEKTLLSMQTGKDIPMVYFSTLFLFSTAIIYGSLSHPSFFFDGPLNFYNLTEEARAWAIQQGLGVDPYYISFVLFALACVSLIYFFLKYKGMLVLKATTLLILIATFGVFLQWYPLNYVYLLHFFLAYHFIVWSIVFYQKFKAHQPERLKEYVRIHIAVLAPILALFCLMVFFDIAVFDRIGAIVFDVRALLAVSFFHITVSFMNEKWFKALLGS